MAIISTVETVLIFTPRAVSPYFCIGLGGELDEVHAELLCRVVEPVLVDGLDALGREPQPHPSISLLPVQAPFLEVNVLHLNSHEKNDARTKKEKRRQQG